MGFYAIPIKINDLIKNLYENSTCTVLVNSERTDPFPVNNGFRQGCILSANLFCIAIDFVMRTTNKTKAGIKCKKCRLRKAASVLTVSNKLGTMWKNESISQKTKLKLYRSNVLSVLLYGGECWSLTAGIEKKLASLHQKCLR